MGTPGVEGRGDVKSVSWGEGKLIDAGIVRLIFPGSSHPYRTSLFRPGLDRSDPRHHTLILLCVPAITQ